MPLNDYVPDYEGKKRIIISEENGRRHIAENSGFCLVTHYKVDGVILREKESCDYILINEDKKFAYLIELKGCRVAKAAEQLKSTADELAKYLRFYNVRFRIIASGVPSRKSRTSNIKNSGSKLIDLWERKGLLVMSTNQLRENI